jgi:peptidoglycan/LPS O-acetylase OafA/YrhL
MFWIIVGHGYMQVSLIPVSNVLDMLRLTDSFLFMLIPGGFFGVDTFFFLSSFLGAYLLILKFSGGKKFTWGMIYFHRYYRIMPPILLCIAFLMTFWMYFGDGPMWSLSQ